MRETLKKSLIFLIATPLIFAVLVAPLAALGATLGGVEILVVLVLAVALGAAIALRFGRVRDGDTKKS